MTGRLQVAMLLPVLMLFLPWLLEAAGAHRGDAMRGRALFNGSAYCADCHGIDGDLTRRPDKGDTTKLIEQLHPPPTDLRRPEGLKLRTDDERMQVIKEGHRGTAMFPHHGLLQQDIQDLLAYLEILRREGHTDRIPHRP